MTGSRSALTRYAWLSIGASIVIICLKTIAYWLTDSVGLLSDALESVVNLVAASVVLIVLTIAARPPDEDHPYGHDKAEYFSSGVEGGMILIMALGIVVAAVERLINPKPLGQLGLGVMISVVASIINFAVARVLLAASREHHSITLEADARHLMTDVWTSVGVVAGVAAAQLTGWHRLDPIIALLVALSILWTGMELVRRSMLGLLDTGLPSPLRAEIGRILDAHREGGVEYHAVRTRHQQMQRHEAARS